MTHLELKYPPGGPEVWGPVVWDSFEDVANSIPCGECRPFGQQLIKAGHDLVNIKLGKCVYDKANLLSFKNKVDTAVQKMYHTNACIPIRAKSCSGHRCSQVN